MRHPFEFIGGLIVLVLMAFTLALIIQPSALSNSVSIYQETIESPRLTDPVATNTRPRFIQAEPIDANINLPEICTDEVIQCQDGSFVGRTGQDCDFDECPVSDDVKKAIECRSDNHPQVQVQCLDVYQPVCGLVQVQCFTAPCDPVLQTFSNVCNACSNSNVISYTDGVCGGYSVDA